MRLVVPLAALFATVATAQVAPPDGAAQVEVWSEMLRDIADPDSDGSLRAALRRTPQACQMLVNWGLGQADERLVFGAAMLSEDPIPSPHLRHAVATILPRLGDADCPVKPDYLYLLLGSVDMPALFARLDRLEEDAAAALLDNCHRLCRIEHVPALCELALRAEPAVARSALGTAALVARYAGAGFETVLATQLQLANLAPIPGDPGLPPVLRGALRALAGTPRHLPGVPAPVDHKLCAHWLAGCRVGRTDQPLLLRVLSWRELGVVAVRSLPDPQAPGVADQVHAEDWDWDITASFDFALARSGDEAALARLFAEADSDKVSLALAAASPARRRAYALELLAAPRAEALATLDVLAQLASGEVGVADVMPYDDAWFAELEGLAATRVVDPRVLRALVASVPVCATGRLADQLLAVSAEELFAPYDEDDVDADLPIGRFSGGLGFSGVWAFLEVTRPERFRERLREGLGSRGPAVRDLCARLLLRMHDAASASALLAWCRERLADETWDKEWWRDLAACGGDEVRRELQRRVETAEPQETPYEVMVALAIAQGMPYAAARWPALAGTPEVLALLLAGKPMQALLASDDVDLPWVAACWPEPALQQAAAPLVRKESLVGQLTYACRCGDRASRDLLQQLCTDGRYATHHEFDDEKAIDRDLSRLSFWIDECGTNCCRYIDSVQPVLRSLFGRDPEYAMNQWPEPLVARLRRHLLAWSDRLRWSTIANGYVVAGN